MNLAHSNTWHDELGLLPVPAFDDSHNPQQKLYVLLNGTKGNFCLDVGSETPPESRRAFAWSANVGHFVNVTSEFIEVQSWAQQAGNIQRYSLTSVKERIVQFYSYLEKASPSPSLSVVSHGIRIFRSLRNALGDAISGQGALEAFLCLLACTKDNEQRDQLDVTRWRISDSGREIAERVAPQEWVALQDDFRQGRPAEKLALEIRLLLRHASGTLFQDAHREAIVFSPQPNFGFFSPDPVSLSKVTEGTGVHFTPPSIARSLVEHAVASIQPLNNPSLVVFDPACGSGEFLREAIRQLKACEYKGEVIVHGWDISSAACALADFSIALESLDGTLKITPHIRCVNSLSADSQWPDAVDLLIMNPPFVSWLGMSSGQKESLSHHLGDLVKQRPDMAAGFIYLASKSLKEGGILATILPASFFDSESLHDFRTFLAASLGTLMLGRLGSHVLFAGATVDAGVYIAQRGISKIAPIALWSDYRSESTSEALRTLRKINYGVAKDFGPVVKSGFSIYRNIDLVRNADTWAPRSFQSLQLLFKAEQTSSRVEDLFHVHQGALTGYNKVFILSRDELNDLPGPEKAYFRPAVLNQSIRGGRLTDAVSVFFPYGSSEISSEDELKAKVGTFYDRVLRDAQFSLRQRKGVDPERWWELTRPRSWQKEESPKLISKYFGDEGSFAWDPTGDYVAVQGYAWLPKKKLSRTLSVAYLALLNSAVFFKLIGSKSNNVGGGQWNLSTRFMKDLPLPDLREDRHVSLVEDLSKLGTKISASGLDSLSRADSELYEVAVNTAFGTIDIVE